MISLKQITGYCLKIIPTKYSYNRNTYAVIDRGMSWSEAKTHCECLGYRRRDNLFQLVKRRA